MNDKSKTTFVCGTVYCIRSHQTRSDTISCSTHECGFPILSHTVQAPQPSSLRHWMKGWRHVVGMGTNPAILATQSPDSVPFSHTVFNFTSSRFNGTLAGKLCGIES